MKYPAFINAPAIHRATTNIHLGSSSVLEASSATTSLVHSLAYSVAVSEVNPGGTLKEYEPIVPDTVALLGIGSVLIVSAAAAWVWANQVVPTSRTKLALSKRQGAVKEYLDGLEQGAPEDERQFEQWLFTDWLEQRNTKASPGRQKEPALPILKKAKWNSGDNPILAATALIMLGVTIAAVTERISLILQ
jgi:hypothetical protein